MVDARFEDTDNGFSGVLAKKRNERVCGVTSDEKGGVV